MERRFVDADRLHALGELAAGVAHDLRNPLAIIKAAAGSLSRADRTPQEMSEHTEVICRNIDRAERTISALLELGKPRALEPRQVDLVESLADVVALVQVEAKRREVAVQRRVEPGIEGHADPKLLSRALLNLLLNALQASPAGSSVTLIARRFDLTTGPVAMIAVEDRGHGIDRSHRDKLFTPFFTTKEDGTGLGLLSTRRLVDEMGGRVALFPRSSGGTRAVLLLPAVAPAGTFRG